MSDVTDEELFASITSNEPPAPEPAAAEPVTPEPAPEPAPKARDENGRFAPSETQETVTEPVQEQPLAAKEPAIPPSRLREEADARRQAEARAAALHIELERLRQQAQPKPEPPKPVDLYEDPNGFVQQQLDPIQSQVRKMNETWSRRFAEQQHGTETVSKAYEALSDAVRSGAVNGPAVVSQLTKSDDPFGEIMSWYQRQNILSEVGTDPKAYRSKILEEALADPANHDRMRAALGVQTPAAPAAPAGNTVRLPPSLNRLTSAASNGAAAGGDVSDRELFESITSRRR